MVATATSTNGLSSRPFKPVDAGSNPAVVTQRPTQSEAPPVRKAGLSRFETARPGPAWIAHLEERPPCKRGVVGSNPTLGSAGRIGFNRVS